MAFARMPLPPAGYYVELPFGQSCRCPQAWTDGVRSYCCMRGHDQEKEIRVEAAAHDPVLQRLPEREAADFLAGKCTVREVDGVIICDYRKPWGA